MRTLPSILVALLSVAACRTDRPQTPGYLSTSYEHPQPEEVSAGSEASAPEETPPAEASYTPGPGGFPLPLDAAQQSGMTPAGTKMSVFKVPRSRDVVAEELRANLAAEGWTIDGEELSPSARALRWKLAKAGATLDVRITGDANDAAIIITEP